MKPFHIRDLEINPPLRLSPVAGMTDDILLKSDEIFVV